MSSGKVEKSLNDNSTVYEVGVIGGGWISTAYHLPILHNIDSTTVSYIADIDKKQAQKASRGYNADAIPIGHDLGKLPECDIVLLAIPVGVRDEYITEFSSRDTPIFSEKPFAVDLEMHRQFMDTANVITCNYMRRHYSATVQLQHVIETGMFGIPKRVVLIEEGKTGATGFSKEHFQTSSEKSGGGILLERGCHSLSQIMTIFPNSTFSVKDAEIIWQNNLDAEVTAQITISKTNSAIDFQYHLSRLRPVGSQLRIEFENLILQTDPFDPQEPLQVRTTSPSERPLTIENNRNTATTTHQAMYLRWQGFFSQLGESKFDKENATMPNVTKAITEIYEKGK